MEIHKNKKDKKSIDTVIDTNKHQTKNHIHHTTSKNKGKVDFPAYTNTLPNADDNILSLKNFKKEFKNSVSLKIGKSNFKKLKENKTVTERINYVSTQFKIANDFDEKGTNKFLKDKYKCLKEMKLTDDIEEMKKINDKINKNNNKCEFKNGHCVKFTLVKERKEKEKKEPNLGMSPIVSKLNPSKSAVKSKFIQFNRTKSIFSSGTGSEDAKNLNIVLDEIDV